MSLPNVTDCPSCGNALRATSVRAGASYEPVRVRVRCDTCGKRWWYTRLGHRDPARVRQSALTEETACVAPAHGE